MAYYRQLQNSGKHYTYDINYTVSSLLITSDNLCLLNFFGFWLVRQHQAFENNTSSPIEEVSQYMYKSFVYA